ncbi:MAG: bifunctional alpha,alpha-trehalose-phosphate synthase (UDP-forming)/trehalose-phosphatase [Desulfobacterales bacterium]|jgi:trehalose 6-phosphate synthase/phosphatase
MSLIVVSNRLPITIGKTIEKSSGGLVYAMEGLDYSERFQWLGWAGGVVDDPSERDRITRELNDRFNYRPIFLSKQEADDYYTGYSNSSLWPLLHYITTYARYEEIWWETYQKINRLFAETVFDLAGADDIIWIHDYHLMLLPSMLRQRRPDLKIGYFLHTPFPSYELFRCCPNREELLEGMLGADLIGFHTFGYLRHFRSTVLRLLGLESEMDLIPMETHTTAVGVYPIGINSEKFLKTLQSDAYHQHLSEYREIYQGKKIVLSVERLDYTKGIPRRLDAIERYLSQTQPCCDDIVFIFINIPSRKNVPEYQELLEDLQGRVGQINGQYTTIKNVPIHFIHKSINFSELCALYSLADVTMVTPLIDGMNLVAKEYLACQDEKNGVLILSEFAGAAQELPNALIVNPYNINEVVQAIDKALTLTQAEKQKMITPMKERVIKYDARYWAESFIKDLLAIAGEREVLADTRELSSEVIDRICAAKKLGLFLDYDGTLAELKKKPSDALPDEEIKELFLKLESVKPAEVFITSGRTKEDMDQWFSRYDFNLIAEHGYYYKHHNAAEWVEFDPQAELSWKNQIIDVFQLYTGMTPGSFVEEKTSSVVWHYRNSDPEFGSWKAHQLVAELYEMLSNLPVEVHHGKKIVEVSSIQINKGNVLEYFMLLNKYDAVLCAGDDETDESMFRLNTEGIISIKIGKEDTAAEFRVSSPRAFRDFLTQALNKLMVAA